MAHTLDCKTVGIEAICAALREVSKSPELRRFDVEACRQRFLDSANFHPFDTWESEDVEG
jgi:hypothetical protein